MNNLHARPIPPTDIYRDADIAQGMPTPQEPEQLVNEGIDWLYCCIAGALLLGIALGTPLLRAIASHTW